MIRGPPRSTPFPSPTPCRPVPARARGRAHRPEIPARALRAQVQARVLDAHVGDADLHTDDAAPGRVERDEAADLLAPDGADRKSTRLNSSHANISYAVFCLK